MALCVKQNKDQEGKRWMQPSIPVEKKTEHRYTLKEDKVQSHNIYLVRCGGPKAHWY